MPVVPPNIHTHRVNAISRTLPHPVLSLHVTFPRDRRQLLRQRPAEEITGLPLIAPQLAFLYNPRPPAQGWRLPVNILFPNFLPKRL